MKDSATWITPKQAGDLCGYTARHIQNLIKSGKLSATREDGKYYIDKAEFFRVFPNAHRKAQNADQAAVAIDNSRMSTEIEHLKEVIKHLKESSELKDKHIEHLTAEIAHLRKSQILLLEHQDSKGKRRWFGFKA